MTHTASITGWQQIETEEAAKAFDEEVRLMLARLAARGFGASASVNGNTSDGRNYYKSYSLSPMNTETLPPMTPSSST